MVARSGCPDSARANEFAGGRTALARAAFAAYDDLRSRYDVVVDGCDNFDTRYVVNDAAVALRKPVVHGSIFRFEGMASTFVPFEGPCYRCLYPEAPPPELAPT